MTLRNLLADVDPKQKIIVTNRKRNNPIEMECRDLKNARGELLGKMIFSISASIIRKEAYIVVVLED